MLQLQLERRGKQFTIPPDDATSAFWHDFARGGWEDGTLAALDRYLTGDSVYLDIGAWIGPTLLYASQIAKRSIGIEPDPVAFAKLRRNIEANCQGKDVTIFNVCLSRRSGPVRLGNRSTMGNSMSSLLFADERESSEVEGLSFRDLLGRTSVDHCDVVKMDIEGGEYTLLPGMRWWLRKRRPVLLLSLHPHLLTMLPRLTGTIRLLWSLASYRQIVDESGTPLTRLNILRSAKWGLRQSVIAIP